jgi:sigma-54 dependent transcriptional regulator, acetoin dehydrogenase operon transcriptional activator AcoR
MPRHSIDPRLLDLALDAVADGLFTVDSALRITSFNRAAEVLTGFSRHEAIGLPCHRVFRTDLCDERCPLKESMLTGRTVTNQEIRARTRSGDERMISVNTAALLDPEGRFSGAVETFRDLTRLKALEHDLAERYRHGDIVSRHPAIESICARLPIIAESDATVLIEGASGTGKGLFAKAVHELSGRSEGPFVHVNLSAIPDGLLEAELFGHVRGAFTDARRDRVGRFEAAGGGTIFLDEIGDAPASTQVKLLRVLQEREFERVGSSTPTRADARVVAATNRELAARVSAGRFREDLFYRLSVFHLTIPPLADRREDVPLLAQHFLEAYATRAGRALRGFSPEAMRCLMGWGFPGNVRELENVVEHACIVARGPRVVVDDLPEALQRPQAGAHRKGRGSRLRVEADKLREVLERNDWNVPRTAAELGVHRTTAWRMVKRFGLRPAGSSEGPFVD